MAEARAQNRYKVLERLESGGMAEVFRGESESVAGFKKLVAIKRVLPHLASNEKFIRMFLDEARLSARLSHANIVQVFDIGHVENTYFIVMEFVDGVNLKGMLEHLRARKQPVSIPVACHIAMKVCEGLFYAHEATDTDGNLLRIVHRDISPPNVLLSKRGEIKIVDFGLAKAAHSVEKTEPGIVKGKFSYLAPETAMGHEADPQADIYAVGIMLWEMLAGRKLFQGETDYQTVKMVQQSVVPSIRAINPGVPDELDKIIKQSLAREKADRYTTAQALGEDLSNFLFSHKLKVTAFDISKVVTEVLAERKAVGKPTGKPDGSVIDQLIQEELLRFTSLGDPSGPSGPDQAPADAGDGARPLDAEDFVNLNAWANETLGDSFDPGVVNGTAGWDEPGSMRLSSSGNLAEELEGEVDGDATIRAPGPFALPPQALSPQSFAQSAPQSVRQAIQPPPSLPPGPSPTSLQQTRKFTALTTPPPEKKFPTRLVTATVVSVVVVGISVGLYFAHVIHLPH